MESVKKLIERNKVSIIIEISMESNEVLDSYFSDSKQEKYFEDSVWSKATSVQLRKIVKLKGGNSFVFHDIYGVSFLFFTFRKEGKYLLFGGWNTENEQNNLVGCFPKQSLSWVENEYRKYKKKFMKQELFSSALRNFIENNLRHGITLEQTAEAFHLSSSSLKRKMKQELGVSFSEFKNGIQVEIAKKMLEEDKRSVDEIAKSVGWKSTRSLYNNGLMEER